MSKGDAKNPRRQACHGKPCARCHGSERLLHDAYCKACRTIVNHDDYMKRKARFAAIRAELRHPIARMRQARDCKAKSPRANTSIS